MADLPILYGTPMIRALQRKMKLETRRVIAPPKWSTGEFHDMEIGSRGLEAICDDTGCFAAVPLRHKVGDRLWVREAWRTFVSLDGEKPSEIWNPDMERGAGIAYEAGGSLSITKGRGDRVYSFGEHHDNPEAMGRRRIGRYMPKFFSRYTLIVTEVEAERLQDITLEGAKAEGIPDCASVALEMGFDLSKDPEGFEWDNRSTIENYRHLWDGLNLHRGYGFDVNPWVSVTRFTLIENNITKI